MHKRFDEAVVVLPGGCLTLTRRISILRRLRLGRFRRGFGDFNAES